ncbi:MAG: acyl--CoA ligase [Halieaceae bacterium]|jgi:long-chain acyl-CoA synthetase|nr:acyl--CoA ligase [Halieaceae bacterium]
MNEIIPSRAEAIATLSAPGKEFELVEETINGNPCRVFRNAPDTIRDLFDHAQQFADLDYLVYQSQGLTFADTYQQAALIARVLTEDLGVKKGDRVAIGMRNYPEWVTSFLAITSIGGIAVALNALWNAEELAYGLELTGSQILIADQERVECLRDDLEQLDLRVLTVRCRDITSERINSLENAIAEKSTGAIHSLPEVSLKGDDDALIIFTSGSTGHPKGAVSSHRAAVHAIMSWDFDASIALWRANMQRPNEPWDIRFSLLVSVPLFHVSASHVGMLQALWRGRCLHLMYRWDAIEALDIIEREQITHFIAVPAVTGDLVRAAVEHGRSLASLLMVGGGGAPRPAQQVRDIDKAFDSAVPGTGWGMTETNAIGAGISGPDYLQRPLSSGQCSAIYDMRILGDDNHDVAKGEPGHLVIRGTGMFRKYWNNPQANAEAFVDGWFRTGDIARIDEEGFLFIVDRAKDIVIRGGENIGCGEVEDAIYRHSGVSEAVVFGLPDERLGEVVAAMVLPRQGQKLDELRLRHHLQDHLATFQIPTRIFFCTSPLPRIASGKFNKRQIRLDTIALLDLDTADT